MRLEPLRNVRTLRNRLEFSDFIPSMTLIPPRAVEERGAVEVSLG
jgi:hypothetical protein